MRTVSYEIMELLDQMQIDGKFDECNEWFEKHNPSQMNLREALAALTITLCDDRLPARQVFYNQLREYLLIHRPNDVEGLIGGLDR